MSSKRRKQRRKAEQEAQRRLQERSAEKRQHGDESRKQNEPAESIQKALPVGILTFAYALWGMSLNGFFGFYPGRPAILLYPFGLLCFVLSLAAAHYLVKRFGKHWTLYVAALLIGITILFITHREVDRRRLEMRDTSEEHSQEHAITTNIPTRFDHMDEGVSNLPKVIVDALQAEHSRKAVWQPPEFPEGCQLVTVTVGGGTVQTPTTWREWGVMGAGSGAIIHTPESPINVRGNIFNKRLYVDAAITWDGITSYTISNMTFIGTMPANWDRNYNSNAFEIVGPDQLPIFQEIYSLPEHIIVNGIFPKRPGIIVGTFGTHLRVGTPQEVFAAFPNRKPVFKYPSWKYPSVLAD